MARDLAGQDRRLTGRLRVTCSETLAYRLLTHHIARFRAAHLSDTSKAPAASSAMLARGGRVGDDVKRRRWKRWQRLDDGDGADATGPSGMAGSQAGWARLAWASILRGRPDLKLAESPPIGFG